MIKFAELKKVFNDKAKSGDPDYILAAEIFNKTNSFLSVNQLAIYRGSMESFADIPQMNRNGRDDKIDFDQIDNLLVACKVPASTRVSTAIEVVRILNGANENYVPFIDRMEQAANSKNLISMARIYGQQTASMLDTDATKSIESFGEYTDRVAADSRLNIALTIMKTHKSLMDRVLARRPEEDPVVTIKMPAPEYYNLEISQSSPSSVRNATSSRSPLITLYRNPSPVDTTPKQFVPLKANDTGSVPWMMSSGTALVTGVLANIYDLATNSNDVSTQHIDFTDLISDGGCVSSIIVQCTHNNAGTIVTELYAINTQYHRDAQYVTMPNVNDSGERGVNINQMQFPLEAGQLMTNGTASSLLTNYTSGNVINLIVNFNSVMNIKTGDIQGNGAVNAALVNNVGGTIPGTLTTDFAMMSFSVVGYSPMLWYSEENLRKTTAAFRVNYKQQQFLIPVGRTCITDYSLTGQEIGEDVLNTTAQGLNLGNDIRGLNIVTNTLTNVSQRLTFEAANPNIDWYHSVAQDYAAGTLSLPYVSTDTLNISQALVMRETEKLSDLHNYVTNRLLGLIADAHNKSLYTLNLEPGEKPVYKIICDTVVKDLLLRITNYYSSLNDKADLGEGADYSFDLPNGARCDVISTTFETMENQMIIIPVRDAKPDDVTSFGTILDRGTYTAQYTPVNNGAANRRIITNSREIVFPTNVLGFVITVTGIDSTLALTIDGQL